ncbi:hypothetical protein [Burkholderia ubonensis]|uniref:hypothetical protein n=1 Tax=Burkholderia ubonensis TaxID=101571 RepID=UPI00075DF804|nr:hypothetical protein [Burkholderia ubonensis]KVP39522.1 hypothetical protein WJ87_04610 [Burkholderia ubonensis]
MYILTRTGRHFSFANPHPSMVVLEDVAHALSLINRYTGHTSYAYSVAQHCVAVSVYLEQTGAPLRVQMAGLLHDAHEAYFGDISAPLKAFLKVGEFEDRIQAVVAEAFGFTLADMKDSRVKLADLTALAVESESEELMPPDTEEWPCLAPVTAEMRAHMPKPFPLMAHRAKERFLARFAQLSEKLTAVEGRFESAMRQGLRTETAAVLIGEGAVIQ